MKRHTMMILRKLKKLKRYNKEDKMINAQLYVQSEDLTDGLIKNMYDNACIKSDEVEQLTFNEFKDKVIMIESNFNKLENFIIPDTWPTLYAHDKWITRSSNTCDIQMFNLRFSIERLVYLSSFNLLTTPFLNALSNYIGTAKCLEVMAGNGCIASNLMQRGVDIVITTDKKSGKKYNQVREWCDNIINLDAVKAIEIYGRDIDYLLMSWPPYLDTVDYKCLMTLRKVNPAAKIIYIGEPGGCTGSIEFYDNVSVHDDVSMINKLMWHSQGHLDECTVVLE